MNGNQGLYAISHVEPQLFYPANYSREGFFINLIGTSVSALGNNHPADFTGRVDPLAIAYPQTLANSDSQIRTHVPLERRLQRVA